MYTENNRYTSLDRANDDFLRRMLGGELTGGERAVMSETEAAPQTPSCSGCATGERRTEQEREERSMRGEARPRCNEGDENRCPQ